jgi:hypothetical protein
MIRMSDLGAQPSADIEQQRTISGIIPNRVCGELSQWMP